MNTLTQTRSEQQVDPVRARRIFRWPLAWERSAYWVGLPYMALSAFAAALSIGYVIAVPEGRSQFRALEILLPLIGAVQASFLFAPDDEPALEIALAAPRPPRYIIFERVAVFLLMQCGVGVVASIVMAIMPGGVPFGEHVVRWVPPLLALSGISAAVSHMFRRGSYGVLVALLLFGATALAGDMLVLQYLAYRAGVTELNVLTYGWLIHPFLPADALDASHYLVNRVVMVMLGVVLFGLMMRWISDEEKTLGKS